MTDHVGSVEACGVHERDDIVGHGTNGDGCRARAAGTDAPVVEGEAAGLALERADLAGPARACDPYALDEHNIRPAIAKRLEAERHPVSL
jgi:hypothetical protein